MTIAYLDCFSGVSGDMTLGALVDAGLSAKKLKAELALLPVEGYALSVSKVVKKGIGATRVTVKIRKGMDQKARHYRDITAMIEKSALSAAVKEKALAIFAVIARAEAKVHRVPIEKVHFHEVGAIDSIVDIVGAAIGFTALGIERLVVSPVNIGSGQVRTEHGILPVPAPATALILSGVPTYADGPAMELTTPTGAAIVTALADSFGGQPAMVVKRIGTGAGGYDLPDRANTLRISLGEALGGGVKTELLFEIAATIDDMNPERYGDVAERLFAAGALDVTLTPVQMKKGRPGIVLAALAQPSKSGAIEEVLFVHTTTLGLRRSMVERVSLPRRVEIVKTGYGSIKVKIATLPDGTEKRSPEYDDVLKAAKKAGVPFETVWRAAVGVV